MRESSTLMHSASRAYASSAGAKEYARVLCISSVFEQCWSERVRSCMHSASRAHTVYSGASNRMARTQVHYPLCQRRHYNNNNNNCVCHDLGRYGMCCERCKLTIVAITCSGKSNSTANGFECFL